MPESTIFISQYLLSVSDTDLMANIGSLPAGRCRVPLALFNTFHLRCRKCRSERSSQENGNVTLRSINLAWPGYLSVKDSLVNLRQINGVIAFVERISSNAN